MIYFITCEEANAVKIGYIGHTLPFSRLSLAQSNCPLKLELAAVCDGYKAEESALHLRFGEARIRGEWFKLTPALREHIAQFLKPEKPLSRHRSREFWACGK